MCSTCSKLRCKVFGIVRGVKTELRNDCGTYCRAARDVRGIDRVGSVHTSKFQDLGSSWSDLHYFIGTLFIAAYDRAKELFIK